MRLSKIPILVTGLLLLGAATFAACGNGDDDDIAPEPTSTPAVEPSPTNGSNNDLPVDSTPPPAGPQQAEGEPIVDARHDLAERLGIDVSVINLISLRHAGFNGCLGVALPQMACTDQFIGGYIAIFGVEGEEYRYHFGGGLFVATGFVEGAQIEDGLEVEPELQYDFNRALAAYAKDDLATRLGIDAGGIVTTAVVPVIFPDGCHGFTRPEAICLAARVSGLVVFFQADGAAYRYHLSTQAMVATDFDDGIVQEVEDAAVVAVQEAMRADLAERLGVTAAEIGIITYRDVTWANACLGVARPDTTCALVLTPGFVAELLGSDGNVYRYHGAGDQFIATGFEPEGTIIDQFPLPAETAG
jgi:hypothetical protein